MTNKDNSSVKSKRKSTYILGLHTGHNATAALLKDGEIIACVSEERFSGIKNHIGFPKKSMEYCLNFVGIPPQELEYAAIPSTFGVPMFVSEKTKAQLSFKMLSAIYSVVGSVRKVWGRIIYYLPKLRPAGTFIYKIATDTYGQFLLRKERSSIARYLGVPEEKIINTGHHLSHAATAYYSSPFNREKALVLTLDAEGDRVCSTVNIFHGNKYRRIAATSRENSLGWMYIFLTEFLGMKAGEHEYKVMGLAPYAKEKDVQKLFEKIKDIVVLDSKNKLKFYGKFNMQDTLYYLKKNCSSVRFDILAGAFQKLLEERINEWVDYAVRKTGIKTVIFSGGVFMNVKANQKLMKNKKIKKAFFMPTPGDESLAIGAAYLAYLKSQKKNKPLIKPLGDLYLGPQFSSKEIEEILKGKFLKKYKITKPKEIESYIAGLLFKGEVVGRVAGRMEWGARALGNRSILANPKNADIVKIINDQMKGRDFWMPFAPTILAERAKDYCQNPERIEAPYMMISFDSTLPARQDLRAAMHPYDFTLRPQILKESWNPSYYKIIKEFERLTGIGAVLNTSFNLHGYPIVLGPKEALYAFENSGLKYLALGDCLICKR